MRKTEMRPWTEDWVTQFYKEEIILKDIFKDELLGIHHIGSTSIPTIGFAIPIVDILVL